MARRIQHVSGFAVLVAFLAAVNVASAHGAPPAVALHAGVEWAFIVALGWYIGEGLVIAVRWLVRRRESRRHRALRIVNTDTPNTRHVR